MTTCVRKVKDKNTGHFEKLDLAQPVAVRIYCEKMGGMYEDIFGGMHVYFYPYL